MDNGREQVRIHGTVDISNTVNDFTKPPVFLPQIRKLCFPVFRNTPLSPTFHLHIQTGTAAKHRETMIGYSSHSAGCTLTQSIPSAPRCLQPPVQLSSNPPQTIRWFHVFLSAAYRQHTLRSAGDTDVLEAILISPYRTVSFHSIFTICIFILSSPTLVGKRKTC